MVKKETKPLKVYGDLMTVNIYIHVKNGVITLSIN